MSSPALFVTTGSNDARRLNSGEVMRSQEAVSQDEIARRIATLSATANDLLLDLRRELPPLTTEARAVLANLNQITGPRNQKQIDGVLAELNTILRRESPKIAQITDRVSALAERADAVVGAVRPLVSNLDATVTNANVTLDAVREPLTKDLAELEKVLQDARALLASVQDVVRGNDAEIADTVRALHAAAENLRAFTEILKQRPWNLIRTTQPPDRECRDDDDGSIRAGGFWRSAAWSRCGVRQRPLSAHYVLEVALPPPDRTGHGALWDRWWCVSWRVLRICAEAEWYREEPHRVALRLPSLGGQSAHA
jgi:hypothetical protein